MGMAYTGGGVRHKYEDLINEASKVYFFKTPPTKELSSGLKELGLQWVKKGFDIECFADPLVPDSIDALYVKGANVFYLQASHPLTIEPTNFGSNHTVIPLYDLYEREKLNEQGALIREYVSKSDQLLEKALTALNEAKKIHDDWETLNISRMDWDKHVELTEEIIKDLMGTLRLNKKGKTANRLIGSLTVGGAKDFVPSITRGSHRRLLIKGLPGTGKSTMMKAIGKEAEHRGLDVLYGWCGLDPRSVDLLVIPELRVSIFDSTPPYEYEVERTGDEIVDIAAFCAKDEEIEKKIEEVRYTYTEKMLDARGYMHSYGDSYNLVRKWVDASISQKKMQNIVNELLLEI